MSFGHEEGHDAQIPSVPFRSAAFESAGRHGSFTKAAEDLAITQSRVSRQIGNLETFLGVRLFERIGSRIVLTNAGGAYLKEISRLLDEIERASIDTVRGRKLDDRLLICAHPTLSSRWLSLRLQGFLTANSAVLIEIPTATQGLDFEATEVDIAILRGCDSWRGLSPRSSSRPRPPSRKSNSPGRIGVPVPTVAGVARNAFRLAGAQLRLRNFVPDAPIVTCL